MPPAASTSAGRAGRRHILGLGLEFLIRAQVQVNYRDPRGQSGEPLRVGTSETTRRAERSIGSGLPEGGVHAQVGIDGSVPCP
jgi:hypothetical protein